MTASEWSVPHEIASALKMARHAAHTGKDPLPSIDKADEALAFLLKDPCVHRVCNAEELSALTRHQGWQLVERYEETVPIFGAAESQGGPLQDTRVIVEKNGGYKTQTLHDQRLVGIGTVSQFLLRLDASRVLQDAERRVEMAASEASRLRADIYLRNDQLKAVNDVLAKTERERDTLKGKLADAEAQLREAGGYRTDCSLIKAAIGTERFEQIVAVGRKAEEF